MTTCIRLLGLPEWNTTSWVTYTTEIYFLSVVEAGKSRIRVLAGLVSGEASLLDSQTCCVFTWPFCCAHTLL